MDRSIFQSGVQLDPSLPDENVSWQMTLDTLTSELGEIGIDQHYLRQTAAFLFSSVLNHLPLLLVGPAGQAIADALSVSMFAITSGSLDASVPFDPKYLLDAESSKDQIISVKNIFSGNWIIPFTEYLQHTRKNFILLHPFPEDLQIEPRSLFRYIHPILTEVILHQIKVPSFLGGRNLENYKSFESKCNKFSKVLLSGLSIPQLHAEHLLKVIADAQQMLGAEDDELSLILAIFPYAYAIGKTNIFSEKVASLSGVSKITTQKIEEFLNA